MFVRPRSACEVGNNLRRPGADRRRTAWGHDGDCRSVCKTSAWKGALGREIRCERLHEQARTSTHPFSRTSLASHFTVPASVQLSKFPRKYCIPFKRTSFSILRSVHMLIAFAKRLAVIRNKIFGLVFLYGHCFVSQRAVVQCGSYRRMLSSMPSLFLSKRALFQAWKSDAASSFRSWARYTSATGSIKSTSSFRSPMSAFVRVS